MRILLGKLQSETSPKRDDLPQRGLHVQPARAAATPGQERADGQTHRGRSPDCSDSGWTNRHHQHQKERIMANGNGIIHTLKKIRCMQRAGITDSCRFLLLNSVAQKLKAYDAMFADALRPHKGVIIDCSKQKAYCPWILICTANFHLGARCAYFVDLLFGWDGRLHVVMIPEVGILKKRVVLGEKAFARKVLEGLAPQGLICDADNICLGTDQGFARRYKWGIVTAEEIDLDKITEDELIDRICVQLKLLKVVYDAIEEEQGR